MPEVHDASSLSVEPPIAGKSFAPSSVISPPTDKPALALCLGAPGATYPPAVNYIVRRAGDKAKLGRVCSFATTLPICAPVLIEPGYKSAMGSCGPPQSPSTRLMTHVLGTDLTACGRRGVHLR